MVCPTLYELNSIHLSWECDIAATLPVWVVDGIRLDKRVDT